MDQQHLMKFPNTRMDLKFWKDMQYLGDHEAIIRGNFKLDYLNQVFANETSLFHYFADKFEVI